MSATDLGTAAASLPEQGWKSVVLARVANTQVKLFRVDPAGLPSEVHADWAESLIMVEGEMQLEMGGSVCSVRAGDHVLIPAGVPHAILPDGQGVFLLVDPEGLIEAPFQRSHLRGM